MADTNKQAALDALFEAASELWQRAQDKPPCADCRAAYPRPPCDKHRAELDASGILYDRGDWLQTYSGTAFYPFDPRPEEIHDEDLAHHLAHQCRFAGACERFYSVAQHSVLVSEAVRAEAERIDANMRKHPLSDEDGNKSTGGCRVVVLREALWGLLHDAHEAYFVDVPRPVKHHPAMAGYQALARSCQVAISRKYGLPLEKSQRVRHFDNALLATEKRDLMKNGGFTKPWAPLPDPLPAVIVPWEPVVAEAAFLERLKRLQQELAAALAAEAAEEARS